MRARGGRSVSWSRPRLWLPLSATALALALPAAAAPQRAAAEAQVRWKGKEHPVSRLPEELAEGPRAAIRAWADLAQRESWRLDLDPEARVLLVTPRRASRAGRYLRLIEGAGAELEATLPAPPREAEAKEGAPSSPPPVAPASPDEIPEDPEEAPVEPIGGGSDEPETTWIWGIEERVLDRETVVLFVFRDESQVGPVLERLEEQHPYLAAWMPAARQLAGWSLEQPLAGLCYEQPSGVEEWDVENEVVHRTAELLCLRRFGPLPAWLVQGFAWGVEHRIKKSIYCFPGRTGFVFQTEHTSWPADLRARFARRADRPLEIGELTALRRGTYDPEAAPLAWGFVDLLSRSEPACLPALAEALRLHRDRENRIDHGDRTWSRDRDYRVPDAVQLELLLRHCGPQILADAPRQLARPGDR